MWPSKDKWLPSPALESQCFLRTVWADHVADDPQDNSQLHIQVNTSQTHSMTASSQPFLRNPAHPHDTRETGHLMTVDSSQHIIRGQEIAQYSKAQQQSYINTERGVKGSGRHQEILSKKEVLDKKVIIQTIERHSTQDDSQKHGDVEPWGA